MLRLAKDSPDGERWVRVSSWTSRGVLSMHPDQIASFVTKRLMLSVTVVFFFTQDMSLSS